MIAQAFSLEQVTIDVVKMKVRMLEDSCALLGNLRTVEGCGGIQEFLKKANSQETLANIAKASQKADEWLTASLSDKSAQVAEQARSYYASMLQPFHQAVLAQIAKLKQDAQGVVEEKIQSCSKALHECIDSCGGLKWKDKLPAQPTWEIVKKEAQPMLNVEVASRMTQCFQKLVKETHILYSFRVFLSCCSKRVSDSGWRSRSIRFAGVSATCCSNSTVTCSLVAVFWLVSSC